MTDSGLTTPQEESVTPTDSESSPPTKQEQPLPPPLLVSGTPDEGMNPLVVAQRKAIKHAVGIGGGLATIAVLVAGGFGAVGYLNSLIPETRVLVMEEMNMSIRIEGAVFPQLFPLPRLAARNISVIATNHEGKPAMIVEKAYITFSPISWMSGGPYLNVHLNNPTVRVTRDFQGDYSIEHVMESILQGIESETTGGVMPLIRSVVIQNGRFFYKDSGDPENHVSKSVLVQDGSLTWYPDKGYVEAYAKSAEYNQRFYRYDMQLHELRARNEVYKTEGEIRRLYGNRTSRITLFEGVLALKPQPIARLSTYGDPL